MTKATGNQSIIRAAIRYCEKAQAEAEHAAAEDGQHAITINQAGKEAYLAALPQLLSRTDVQAYIACVAAGQADGVITAADSRQLLYTAQLALAAHSGGKQ